MPIPLYKMVLESIIDEIRSNRLKVGDKVLSETALAEKFGVSRITSKHALNELQDMGVITRVRGKGSFVSSHSTSSNDITNWAKKSEPKIPVSEGVIGMIVPGFADTYGATLVHAVEKRAWEHGLYVMLKDTYGYLNVEEQAISDMVAKGCGGLVVFPVHGERYNEKILRLQLDHFPVVLVDRYLPGVPVPSVHTDNVAASEDLTDHLIQMGHRNIAFVSPPPENTSSIEDRLLGFSRSFAKNKMPMYPQNLITEVRSTLTLDGSEKTQLVKEDLGLIRTFIESHPETTAFVACEYEIMLLIERALSQLGYNVPSQCSIACFDSPRNTTAPSLITHIDQDENQIGMTAVDLLVARMKGETVPVTTTVPHKLVRSASTAPVRD